MIFLIKNKLKLNLEKIINIFYSNLTLFNNDVKIKIR